MRQLYYLNSDITPTLEHLDLHCSTSWMCASVVLTKLEIQVKKDKVT